jgi:hypothetical protein
MGRSAREAITNETTVKHRRARLQSPDDRLTLLLALQSGAEGYAVSRWGAPTRAVRYRPPGGADHPGNASCPANLMNTSALDASRRGEQLPVSWPARRAGGTGSCCVSGLSTLMATVSPSCAARLCFFSHTWVATVTSQVRPRKVCRSPRATQVTSRGSCLSWLQLQPFPQMRNIRRSGAPGLIRPAASASEATSF